MDESDQKECAATLLVDYDLSSESETSNMSKESNAPAVQLKPEGTATTLGVPLCSSSPHPLHVAIPVNIAVHSDSPFPSFTESGEAVCVGESAPADIKSSSAHIPLNIAVAAGTANSLEISLEPSADLDGTSSGNSLEEEMQVDASVSHGDLPDYVLHSSQFVARDEPIRECMDLCDTPPEIHQEPHCTAPNNVVYNLVSDDEGEISEPEKIRHDTDRANSAEYADEDRGVTKHKNNCEAGTVVCVSDENVENQSLIPNDSRSAPVVSDVLALERAATRLLKESTGAFVPPLLGADSSGRAAMIITRAISRFFSRMRELDDMKHCVPDSRNGGGTTYRRFRNQGNWSFDRDHGIHRGDGRPALLSNQLALMVLAGPDTGNSQTGILMKRELVNSDFAIHVVAPDSETSRISWSRESFRRDTLVIASSNQAIAALRSRSIDLGEYELVLLYEAERALVQGDALNSFIREGLSLPGPRREKPRIFALCRDCMRNIPLRAPLEFALDVHFFNDMGGADVAYRDAITGDNFSPSTPLAFQQFVYFEAGSSGELYRGQGSTISEKRPRHPQNHHSQSSELGMRVGDRDFLISEIGALGVAMFERRHLLRRLTKVKCREFRKTTVLSDLGSEVRGMVSEQVINRCGSCGIFEHLPECEGTDMSFSEPQRVDFFSEPVESYVTRDMLLGLTDKVISLLNILQTFFSSHHVFEPIAAPTASVREPMAIIHAGRAVVAAALSQIIRAMVCFRDIKIRLVMGDKTAGKSFNHEVDDVNGQDGWQGHETDDESISAFSSGEAELLIVASENIGDITRWRRPIPPCGLSIRFDGSLMDPDVDGGGGRCRVITFWPRTWRSGRELRDNDLYHRSAESSAAVRGDGNFGQRARIWHGRGRITPGTVGVGSGRPRGTNTEVQNWVENRNGPSSSLRRNGISPRKCTDMDFEFADEPRFNTGNTPSGVIESQESRPIRDSNFRSSSRREHSGSPERSKRLNNRLGIDTVARPEKADGVTSSSNVAHQAPPALRGPGIQVPEICYLYSIVPHVDSSAFHGVDPTGVSEFVLVLSQELKERDLIVDLNTCSSDYISAPDSKPRLQLRSAGTAELTKDEILLGRQYSAALFATVMRHFEPELFQWGEADRESLTRKYLVLPVRPESEQNVDIGKDVRPFSTREQMIRYYFGERAINLELHANSGKSSEITACNRQEGDLQSTSVAIDWKAVDKLLELRRDAECSDRHIPIISAKIHSYDGVGVFDHLEGTLVFAAYCGKRKPYMACKLDHRKSPLTKFVRQKRLIVGEEGNLIHHEQAQQLIQELVQIDNSPAAAHTPKIGGSGDRKGNELKEVPSLRNSATCLIDNVDRAQLGKENEANGKMNDSGPCQLDTDLLKRMSGNPADTRFLLTQDCEDDISISNPEQSNEKHRKSYSPGKANSSSRDHNVTEGHGVFEDGDDIERFKLVPMNGHRLTTSSPDQTAFAMQENASRPQRRRKLQVFNPEENKRKRRRSWFGPICETFENYFAKSRMVPVQRLDQPLLRVARPECLKLDEYWRVISGRSLSDIMLEVFEATTKANPDLKIYLIPELMKTFPLKAGALFLPALLHRVEGHLATCALRDMFVDSVGTPIAVTMLTQAITPASVDPVRNYERLELLGDAVLKLAATLRLFVAHPHHAEGDMHLARCTIVSNNVLQARAQDLGLQNYFNVRRNSSSDWTPPGWENDVTSYHAPEKCVADIVEAIAGAFYLSGVAAFHESMQGRQAHILQKDGSQNEWSEMVLTKAVYSGYEAGSKFYEVIGVLEGPSPDAESILRSTIHSLFPLGSLPPADCTDASFPNDVRWKLPCVAWEQHLGVLESSIGYRFKRRQLLYYALTHASYADVMCATDASLVPAGGTYQRLEFLGDAAIDFCVARYLFDRYPNEGPGELTDLKAAVVSNESLARVAVKYGMHKYLYARSPSLSSEIDLYLESLEKESGLAESSSGMIWLNDREAPKVLGDIFEAVAGAILVDSGLETVWDVCMRLLEDAIRERADPTTFETHPVRVLLEYVTKEQRLSTAPPHYVIQEQCTRRGMIHADVYIHKMNIGSGEGSTKKRAMCRAAMEAYQRLTLCPEGSSDAKLVHMLRMKGERERDALNLQKARRSRNHGRNR